MIKRISAILACLAVLWTSTFVLAAEVYVTKSGTKYHTEDCPLIANRETQAIEEKEAEAKGLTPCARCLAKTQISSSEEQDDVVYVTKSGTKYHKPDCNLIKNRQTSEISKEEAIKRGLEPCGKCFKQQEED